jgi:hypothetical protein
MEDEEQAQAPQLQQAKAAPTLTELSQEATAAQKQQFQDLLPLMGQLEQERVNVQGRIAPQLLEQQIGNQRLYGPQLIGLAIDAAKQADPSGFSLRESLVQRAQQGLNAGGGLSPEEQKYMTEDLKQAQVNRGFGTGQLDAIDEARFLNSQRFGREQARMQSALAALSGKGAATDNFNSASITPQYQQNPGLVAGLLTGPTGFMNAGQNAFGQQMSVNDYNNNVNFANWSNNQQPQSGGLMGAFSGGLAGASAGSALGPWGALGGGVLGAVGGGLAKRRQ